MKNVKMIITTVAILATVGGALAFKSKSYGSGNIFCNSAAPKHCNVAKTNWSTLSNLNTTSTNPCGDNAYSTTSSSTTACPANTNTVYSVTD